MSKYDYLHALYQELISLDISERSTIMRDVENKFREAEDQGLSELSVTNKLGHPAQYASKILSTFTSDEASSDINFNPSNSDASEVEVTDVDNTTDTVSAVDTNDVSKEFLEKDYVDEKADKPSIDLSSSLIIGHDAKLVRAKDLVDVEDLIDEKSQAKTRPTESAPKESDIKEKSTKGTSTPPIQARRARPPRETRKPRVQQVTKYHHEETQPQKVYTTPYPVQKKSSANHPVKMLAIALGLFFFNLTFVIAPFLAIWSVVITLIATGFIVALAGVGVLISAFLSIPMAFISVPTVFLNHPILLICFGFLILGLGGLLTIANIYCVRFFGMLTARYLGWNIRLIRGY